MRLSPPTFFIYGLVYTTSPFESRWPQAQKPLQILLLPRLYSPNGKRLQIRQLTKPLFPVC